MRQPNPKHIERLLEIVNRAPFPSLLTFKVTRLVPGAATLEVEIQEKHLQPFGVAHGGVLATLVDSAAFWATYLGVIDDSAAMTTVDLKLNYLAPVSRGLVYAQGHELKSGKRLCYAEASVFSEDGILLAHGTSTIMILPGKGLQTDPPLPSKFL